MKLCCIHRKTNSVLCPIHYTNIMTDVSKVKLCSSYNLSRGAAIFLVKPFALTLQKNSVVDFEAYLPKFNAETCKSCNISISD